MVDFELGKIFVGGIPWETTQSTLTDHFTRFGDVSSSTIAIDRSTGKPRGFAFVTFSDPSSVDKALSESHEIAGRSVEVKRAKSRGEQQHCNRGYRESSVISSGIRTKKIFVGGLSANLSEEGFRGYFERFGRITDVVVMHDNVTNRPRGFGFITFESEDSVEAIMRNSFHDLGGKYVEVKRAIPKESRNWGSNGNNSSGDGGSERGSSQFGGGYWAENVHSGFYLSHGCVPALGYNGVYGAVPAGYHMAWPGYGNVGYGMPAVPATNHWNGPGMVGYGPMPYGPSSVYNIISGAGSFGVCNVVDNGVGIEKLVHDGGSNRGVQDNNYMWANEGLRSDFNGSSTPKIMPCITNSKRNQRQRSFDRKQKPLVSGDSN